MYSYEKSLLGHTENKLRTGETMLLALCVDACWWVGCEGRRERNGRRRDERERGGIETCQPSCYHWRLGNGHQMCMYSKAA